MILQEKAPYCGAFSLYSLFVLLSRYKKGIQVSSRAESRNNLIEVEGVWGGCES